VENRFLVGLANILFVSWMGCLVRVNVKSFSWVGPLYERNYLVDDLPGRVSVLYRSKIDLQTYFDAAISFHRLCASCSVLVRSGNIHMVKRDSFGGKTWGGQAKDNNIPGAVCTFKSNGKTIVKSYYKERSVEECDPTTSKWSLLRSKEFVYQITSDVCCPIKPGLFVFGDDQGELETLKDTPLNRYVDSSHSIL
jgi:hypothetical protein